MSKRAPKLQFTDEELAVPEVSKAAKKAAKRIEKLERLEAKIPMKMAQKSRAQRPSCSTPFGMRPVRLSVQRCTGKSRKARMITSAWRAHISWKKLPSRPSVPQKPRTGPTSSSRTAAPTAQKLAPTAPTLTRCKSRHSSRARNCKAIHIPAGSRSAPSKRNMPLQRQAAAQCVRPKSLPKPPSVPRRTRKSV